MGSENFNQRLKRGLELRNIKASELAEITGISQANKLIYNCKST